MRGLPGASLLNKLPQRKAGQPLLHAGDQREHLMPQSTLEGPTALLVTSSPQPEEPRQQVGSGQKGFGGGKAGRGGKRKASSTKRSQKLSKDDWAPMGKHPDLDAIVARQRLHLPRSGRLTEAEVNQAWKRCASEHHPDRGGEHHTMQLVNGARDLLLGRQLS